MNIKKIIIPLLFSGSFATVHAQDTTAMIKEFNKVLSFSTQPYLYYAVHTKMSAAPVLEAADTSDMAGVFYKKENDVYYRNGQEEVFLEDSLYIQISNEKKSITISKVNTDTKKNMNLSPLDEKKMQELFRKKYIVSRSVLNEHSAALSFENRTEPDSILSVTTQIKMQYRQKNYEPEQMDMLIKIKQQADDAIMQQVKEQGYAMAGLTETENGINYLVRSQRFSILFTDLNFTKEKAGQLPLWQEKINYDNRSGEFSGKGDYKEYDITKTF